MTPHHQTELPLPHPRRAFDGVTYDPARDHGRLRRQLDKVFAFMSDGQWYTLAELAEVSGGSESSVSARLRDLRKDRYGAHVVERRHVRLGQWQYRLIVVERSSQ